MNIGEYNCIALFMGGDLTLWILSGLLIYRYVPGSSTGSGKHTCLIEVNIRLVISVGN